MDHSINHAKNHSANRKETRSLALITGGSSGIGYALAREFYIKGYDLVLVGRDEKKLRRAAAHLVQKSSKCQRQEDKVNNIYGGRVETVSCDLHDCSHQFLRLQRRFVVWFQAQVACREFDYGHASFLG